MRKHLALLIGVAVVFAAGFVAGNKLSPVQAKDKPGTGFAAAPGEMGVQDVFGPYEVVKGWPKNISTVPGNEKWTWGAGQSVYAESPNRIFLLFRGELPNIPAARDQIDSRVWTQPAVPDRPSAVARCDGRRAAGGGRQRPGSRRWA